MKSFRFWCLLLSVFLLFSSSVFADGIKVKVNERLLNVEAVSIKNRVLVPLRAIFESLGAEVFWDGKTQTITGTNNTQRVTLQIGNKVAKVNNRNVTLDVPPQIMNGKTMVPVRFIAESLGEQVEWDGKLKIVSVGCIESKETPNIKCVGDVAEEGSSGQKQGEDFVIIEDNLRKIITDYVYTTLTMESNKNKFDMGYRFVSQEVEEDLKKDVEPQTKIFYEELKKSSGDIKVKKLDITRVVVDDPDWENDSSIDVYGDVEFEVTLVKTENNIEKSEEVIKYSGEMSQSPDAEKTGWVFDYIEWETISE